MTSRNSLTEILVALIIKGSQAFRLVLSEKLRSAIVSDADDFLFSKKILLF